MRQEACHPIWSWLTNICNMPAVAHRPVRRRTQIGRLASLLMWVPILLALTSCEHKELCMHHPHSARVRIDVDWSRFVEDNPSGMSVMIFPAAENPSRTEEDFGTEPLKKPVTILTNTLTHAYVTLPMGDYHVMVYNQSPSEFGSISFRGMDRYETAEVYSNDIASRWYHAKGDEKVGIEPEWLGTHRQENLSITPEMVEETGKSIISTQSARDPLSEDIVLTTLYPENIIWTLTVKVHLQGIKNLRSARAAITGMSEGYRFSTASYLSDVVTHLMENWRVVTDENDPNKGYVTAELACFGLPGGHAARPDDNKFTVSLLLKDNKTIVELPFSVGDRIERDPSKRLGLLLELAADKPLPDVIPEGSSASGFDAVVDDWGPEENFDVNV